MDWKPPQPEPQLLLPLVKRGETLLELESRLQKQLGKFDRELAVQREQLMNQFSEYKANLTEEYHRVQAAKALVAGMGAITVWPPPELERDHALLLAATNSGAEDDHDVSGCLMGTPSAHPSKRKSRKATDKKGFEQAAMKHSLIGDILLESTAQETVVRDAHPQPRRKNRPDRSRE